MWKNVTNAFDAVGGNWFAGMVVKGLRIKVEENLFIRGNKNFKLSQDWWKLIIWF